MPKRSRIPPADENVAARRVVERIEALTEGSPKPAKRRKNPAAVALGRKGGRKGGPARAKKLSAEQRKASAKKAAAARWQKPAAPPG